MNVGEVLTKLEIEPVNSGVCGDDWVRTPSGGELTSSNPADGSVLARVRMATAEEYDVTVRAAAAAFERWRMLPAPKRGDIVREIANELRAHKVALGTLVSMEMGKILGEGLGE